MRSPETPRTKPVARPPSWTRSSTCRSRHGTSRCGCARSQPCCCCCLLWQPSCGSGPARARYAPRRPAQRLLALPVCPGWGYQAEFLRGSGPVGRNLSRSLILHQRPQKRRCDLSRVCGPRPARPTRSEKPHSPTPLCINANGNAQTATLPRWDALMLRIAARCRMFWPRRARF